MLRESRVEICRSYLNKIACVLRKQYNKITFYNIQIKRTLQETHKLNEET